MDREAFEVAARQALVLADQLWFIAWAAGLRPSYLVDGKGEEVSQYLAGGEVDGIRGVSLVQRQCDGQPWFLAQVDHWDQRSDEPDAFLGQGDGTTPEEAFRNLFENLRVEAGRLEAEVALRAAISS